MKKILLTMAILINVMLYAQVQEAWVARSHWSNASYFETANDVVVDNDGNVYIVGNIDDADIYIDDDDPNGMVTIKYDKYGNLVWRSLFRRYSLEGSSIAIDGLGNVYVMGFQHFQGTGESVRTDFVTIKYNSLGQQQWQRSYNGPSSYAKSGYLGLDAARNVYIAGSSKGEVEDDGTVDGIRESDYAVIKYDNNGNQLWVKRYNGAAPTNMIDELNAMIVEPAGNVYVTGTSQKDGRISTTTIKYANDGTELWVARNNKTSTSTDEGNEITYDLDGNIYVTGGFKDNNTFGFETIKYNNLGVKQWSSYYDAPDGFYGNATSIVVDHLQNSYIVGYTRNSNINAPMGNLKLIKYNSTGVEQWNSTYDASPPWNLLEVIYQYNDLIANIALGIDANIYIATSMRSNYLTLKYNSTTGSLIWEKEYDSPTNNYDNARSIWLDASDNIYVTGTSNAGTIGLHDMTTIKYTQCQITCPANITVNVDPGTCSAVVNYAAATTTGYCGSDITYSHVSGSTFNVGTTTVTVTSTETGATCSFDITVVDNQNPVITCPNNITVNTDPGVCYASAGTVNAVPPGATDNCSPVGVTGVRSDGASLGADYPAGTTTITWTATDPSNNTATCTQTVTVEDNDPPDITIHSVSHSVLSPPNHKMIDITVDYEVTDNCSATTNVTVTSDEPETGLSNGDLGPDIIKIDNNNWQLRAERDGKGDGRVYTILITATDGSGNISTATETVVVAHNIGSPHSGHTVRVGSTVSFSGTFWDVPGNKHTAKWFVDDKAVKASLKEPSGMRNGTVTGSYKFTTPGVYKLRMEITDQNGVTTTTKTNGDLEAIIVVYDPNGGYTFGGGYFASPAGALRSDLLAKGDAGYGFTINYYKTATMPKGETQFDFKVGDFEFNALNFDYLVISNSMAQFRGTGKIIGGQSGVEFIMTVIDGELDGTGIDKVRMKIYNKNTNEVYYDNQPGASDASLPVTPVGENSSVVIFNSQANSITSAINENQLDIQSIPFRVMVYPNPGRAQFTLRVNSIDLSKKVHLQVTDMLGRIIESKMIAANENITFGKMYRPGAYYLRIIQGENQRQLQLIKLHD